MAHAASGHEPKPRAAETSVVSRSQLGTSPTADHVREALRHGKSGGVVAGMKDTLTSVLALHVADIFDGLGESTPLGALERHDRQHGSELVATAHTFLDMGGDVANSSTALHVHPNTLRNRLRRYKDICGVDLADADTRLILMLQTAQLTEACCRSH